MIRLELSVRLPQWIYGVNPSRESVPGSFLFGIMTAVLSTPCTAPFMGAAMAWAAGKPPAITLGTFVAIGTGMALPYLVIHSPDGKQVFASDAYTVDQVLKAVEEAEAAL